MKKSAIGILFLFIAASMAQAAVFKGSVKNLNDWQVSYYASVEAACFCPTFALSK